MSDTTIKSVFAKRLKELREIQGLSQIELAKELDVSRGSINYYESMDRTASIDFVYKAAKFFNCTTDYLLGLSIFKNEKSVDNIAEICKEIASLPEFERVTLTKIILSYINIVNLMNSVNSSAEYYISLTPDIYTIVENIESAIYEAAHDTDELSVENFAIKNYIIDSITIRLKRYMYYISRKLKHHLLDALPDDRIKDELFKEFLNALN